MIEKLRNAGVQTSLHYPPIHQFSYYRKRFQNTHLPFTEFVSAHEVTLPLYPTMDEVAFDTVVHEFVNNLD